MATILSRERWVNVTHSFQNWHQVRTIAGRSGDNSLKVRCVKCDPASVPTETMDLVREVINKGDFSIERVKCVSCACALLAQWVRDRSCPALIWIHDNYEYEYMCKVIGASRTGNLAPMQLFVGTRPIGHIGPSTHRGQVAHICTSKINPI